VRLIDPATDLPGNETVADLWRSVPSVLNVKLTGPDGRAPGWPRGPNTAGGYQLDGRIDTLQNQAHGALLNHGEVNAEPSERLLDDIAAFERVLFSSERVRSLSQAIDDGTTPLPDPDPVLTALEQQGKAVFTRSCAQCHGGSGTSTPLVQPPIGHAPTAILRYNNIESGCPRAIDFVQPPRWQFAPCPPSLARNVRTYEMTLPDGTKTRRTTSDPGRALLTGFVLPLPTPPFLDDWSKLDTPPLRGISKTAPYFHNNSAATLDDVLDHYAAFFKKTIALAPPGIVAAILTTNGIDADRPFTDAERPALRAYLNKL
jgi:cytochrome c peroxidase